MIAIYAGTFDPPTAGHLSIVRQAVRLYAHVIVLVAVNPAKRTLFTPDERIGMLRDEVRMHPNVSVAATEGLVVEYARKVGASVMLRGIRGATDAQFETDLARNNAELAPEIASIFLPAAATLAEVSSSGLKQRVLAGVDVSLYCSPAVSARLREKLLGSTASSVSP